MSQFGRVDRYMSPNPVTLGAQDDVAAARRAFVSYGFSVVPIVDASRRLVGVVSASDLLGSDAEVIEGRLESIMTPRVVTVSAHDSIAGAARLLVAHRIHHVVVVDAKGRPMGVLSSLDVATAVAEAGLRVPISEIMSRDLVSVDAGTPLEEALALLEDGEVTAAVVTDQDELVGTLSKLALLRVAEREADNRVDAVMDRNVLSLSHNTSVSDAARVFNETEARRLVVLNGADRVVGIVTPTDIAGYAASLADYDEFDEPEAEALDDGYGYDEEGDYDEDDHYDE